MITWPSSPLSLPPLCNILSFLSSIYWPLVNRWRTISLPKFKSRKFAGINSGTTSPDCSTLSSTTWCIVHGFEHFTRDIVIATTREREMARCLMKLPSKSSKLFKSIPGGRSVENYRRGATRPYVERLRRRRVAHDGSRPRRDSTEAFTSVRREIDRRVARSVASKSMGTAGTAFRTFDSWKTDGQVFSPPLPYRYEEGWPCFSGEILRKKEEGEEKGGQGK